MSGSISMIGVTGFAPFGQLVANANTTHKQLDKLLDPGQMEKTLQHEDQVVTIAQLYLKVGQEREARQWLTRVLRRNPYQHEARRLLSELEYSKSS